jgi:hypothetical protein
LFSEKPSVTFPELGEGVWFVSGSDVSDIGVSLETNDGTVSVTTD